METPADLNARADAVASIYDGVALFSADPGLDGSNMAAGSSVQAVTFTAGGAEGPAADFVGVDGLCWSSSTTHPLTEVATHIGLYSGGTFMRGAPLPEPLGPGTIPLVFAVGPAAD